jgi:hypothetical protein
LLDYSPKLVPLMILKILRDRPDAVMSIHELSEQMSHHFFGQKRPERRSMHDSIRMLYETGHPIGEVKQGQTRLFYFRKN